MSYLNNSHSLNYSLQGQDSTESEVEFLKVKLIETHTKFIKQLETTKDLEFKVAQYQQEQSFLKRENQELRRKFQHSQHDRVTHDKLKHVENILAQSEKKNDLLRNDLEIMRTKTLQLVSKNQELQREIVQYDQNQQKIHDKLNNLSNELKIRQMNAEQYRQEAQRYRIKYEKQVTNNQQAQQEIQDLKRQKVEVERLYEHIENALAVEKDKQNKQFHEILMLQKENKEWKNKIEGIYQENSKMKNQLYELRARTKNQQRNLAGQLERLTQDYNNLQSIIKQKDFEIESARKRPLEGASKKKKSHFEQTKQLVGKLEREQQIVSRGSPTKDRLTPSRYAANTAHTPKASGKPSRSYKEEKEEYLNIIENVGTMQSQMLAHNMEKKRLLSQIDKIDQTRVKTKDMISRRRRLQVELQNQQRKLEHVKSELKRMKVM